MKPTSLAPSQLDAATAAARAQAQQMEIVRKLSATMMLGQRLGMPGQVQPIYRVLSSMLQNERMLDVGLALASASAGNVLPAWKLITEAMLSEPEDELAVLAMALALKKAGDPQWRSVIEEALADTPDSAVRRFADLVDADDAQLSLLEEDAA